MRTRLPVCLLVIFASLTLSAGDPNHTVKIDGYSEFRHGDHLIVDGQRVRADQLTRFKGPGITSIDDIPLGYEVKAQGVRLADGAIVASKIEARENGSAFLEREVRAASDEAENAWVMARTMFDEREDGSRVYVGRIEERGPRVDRAQRVLDRLLPPYVDRSQVRVRVVDNRDWNAAAMGNGALWVYSGLLDAVDDEELSVVLGHELAHYTHEHSRRQFKRGLIGQLFVLGAVAGARAIDNGKARAATTIGAVLTGVALASSYSRDQEDQADRVGLRYVHEAGYDVASAPGMWQKFRRKYGNGDPVTSFLFGSHSRPSDRVRNVEREIAINYSDGAS
jgi:Zn-dependent protease with chaperone function